MKKPNRRTKRPSVAEPPTPAKDEEQQNCEKRVHDLEIENEALKREIEELKHRPSNISPTSSGGVLKPKEGDPGRLRALEEQVMELKKKLTAESQLSIQRRKNVEAGRVTEDEIQRLKAHKVQLLCKMKLDRVQFRLSKTSLEKEVLQLKKEQRKNEYEMRKLLALNQRQKLVLQQKTKEASVAVQRLNNLLESRKASSQRTSGSRNGNSPGAQGIELELKVASRVEEIRSEYERQMEEMADEVRKFEEESEMLREENFRLMLQYKEVDCMVKESELRDLKEELFRLNSMVGQLGTSKALEAYIKKSQVDPPKSSGSTGSRIQVQLSDVITSESECSGGIISTMEKSATGACCSCSKKSLCKTTKCECRAAGCGCGSGCGCAASKCTNREALSKVEASLRPEVTQNLAHTSGTSETEKAVITCQPAGLNNDCEPRRKPLCEIGNTMNNVNPVKPVQKTRVRKPAIQLDTAVLSLSATENAGGPRREEIPMKLTRSMRSAVSSENP